LHVSENSVVNYIIEVTGHSERDHDIEVIVIQPVPLLMQIARPRLAAAGLTVPGPHRQLCRGFGARSLIYYYPCWSHGGWTLFHGHAFCIMLA
jgi:hypothetical protein